MSTTTTSLNVFHSYLVDNFYSKVNFPNSNVSVYYNSFVYDILTVIPFEHKDSIVEVTEFSDYITFISDSSNKIDVQDDHIGIVYIDTKIQDKKESIVIARLPSLQKTNSKIRQELLSKSFSKDFYQPFWVNYFSSEEQTRESPAKSLDNAKLLIDRAIVNYCKKNNLPRDTISDVPNFVEYIAPDVFKNKIASVSEEQQMREEAQTINTVYPTVLLKILVKMEYLE
jgi:hypothetical protein